MENRVGNFQFQSAYIQQTNSFKAAPYNPREEEKLVSDRIARMEIKDQAH